jgi:hypothetical protein
MRQRSSMRSVVMPVAIAGGIIAVIAACSATNFAGGSGKAKGLPNNGSTAGGDPGAGTAGGDPGAGTAGGPQVPFTQVQQACADAITADCKGKTSQADINACLEAAAKQKNTNVSSSCLNTLNQFNNPSIGGNVGGSTAGPTAGGTAGGNTTTIGSDGGMSAGSTSGITQDGGGTLTEGHSDLILTYSAYTHGDGDTINTATMQFTIQGPNDQNPVPVSTAPLVPTGDDNQNAASMQTVRVPNECVCGKSTTFKLHWTATGGKGTFQGGVETDDQYMWLMSRNPPGQPDSGRDTHWSDDATGVGPSGTNVMYMGEDHPAAGGAPCSVPYFYCGTFSQQAACPNHPWDCMDDIRLRWQCDTSACGSNAAGTDLDIAGSTNHTLDPTP